MSLPELDKDHGAIPGPAAYEAVEELAYHGFTVAEISEVLQVDQAWLSNKEGDAYKAYRRGFLKSQLELRQRIFLDAKHGSSPAQAMARKILEDADYKLNFYE